jgi:hypothetical protein
MAKTKGRRVKEIGAIGEFVISFSQLEFIMRCTFERMMGLTSEQSDIVLASYDFAALCRAIGAFAGALPERDEGAQKRIEKLTRECLRINTERVRIVHGTWGISGGTKHISRNTFKSDEYFARYEDMANLLDATNNAFEQFATILIEKDKVWGPITRYLHAERTTARDDTQGSK